MTAVAQAAGCLGIRENDLNSARVVFEDDDWVTVEVQYAHGLVRKHKVDKGSWERCRPTSGEAASTSSGPDPRLVKALEEDPRIQAAMAFGTAIADAPRDPVEPIGEPAPKKTAKKKRARKKAAKKRKSK